MDQEAVCDTEGSIGSTVKLTDTKLTVQAFATSIDAFAVGISLALLSINILYAAGVIGVVAFLFAVTGGVLGKIAGGALQKRAGIFGGVVLVLIGFKILAEHVIF